MAKKVVDINETHIPKILEMVEQGVSPKNIASHFGASRNTLILRLSNMDLEIVNRRVETWELRRISGLPIKSLGLRQLDRQ